MRLVTSTTRSLRRPATVLSSLSLLLGAGLLAPSTSAEAASCGRPSGCNRYELIHAGSTYGWYPAAQRQEFEKSGTGERRDGHRPPRAWSLAGQTDEWNERYGTLQTKQSVGDSFADWNRSHRYGRWEVRFRSKTSRTRSEPGSRDYQVKLELVPSGAPARRCTPQSILMAGYDPATAGRTATVGVSSSRGRLAAGARTVGPLYDVDQWKPQQNVHDAAWRVWAVEVTRTHVSWFLDGKVIRRENRSAAQIRKPLHLRLSLLSVPGGPMARVVTQIDWARYWPLKHQTKSKRKLRQLRNAPGLSTVRRNPAPGC